MMLEVYEIVENRTHYTELGVSILALCSNDQSNI